MSTDSFLELLVSILTTIIASSGFWLLVQKKKEGRDLKGRLLMGLAHDRIVWLGLSYIKKGCISRDEYENLHDYIYMPYRDMGGNGACERIMLEISKLPTNCVDSIKENRDGIKR